MGRWNRKGNVLGASMCVGVAAIALLARAPLSRAADADGLTMDEEMKVVPANGGQTTDIKMHVESRGDASRSTMDMAGMGNGSIILRPGDGRTIMLMPQMNMYMVVPAAQTPAATSQPAGDITATDTGKSQKIDGHDAEGYLVVTKSANPAVASQEMTFWMSKDIPDAAKIAEQFKNAPLTPMGGRGGRGARGGGGATPTVSIAGMPADAGIPLRMEMTEGNDKVTVDFANFKLAPIPDADLQIPAGYQDMSNMMQGMPNMPSTPGTPNMQNMPNMPNMPGGR
jgi:hypothetical protein